MTLTPRQAQVLEYVAAGYQNHEIAAEIGVSKSAVRQCVARLSQKLDGRNRAGLVARAFRAGILR